MPDSPSNHSPQVKPIANAYRQASTLAERLSISHSGGSQTNHLKRPSSPSQTSSDKRFRQTSGQEHFSQAEYRDTSRHMEDTWRGGGSAGGGLQADGPTTSWGRGEGSAGGRGRNRGGRGGKNGGRPAKQPKAAKTAKIWPTLPAPLLVEAQLRDTYKDYLSDGSLQDKWLENPKNEVTLQILRSAGSPPEYNYLDGIVEGTQYQVTRCSVLIDGPSNTIAYGDGRNKKEAEKAASLHALFLLRANPRIDARQRKGGQAGAVPAGSAVAPKGDTVTLQASGIEVDAARAREFLDFYCSSFKFGKPGIVAEQNLIERGRGAKQRSVQAGWRATMTIGGQVVGVGVGTSKKAATTYVYLDTISHIEAHDPELFMNFHNSHKPGAPIGMAPHVYLALSEELDAEIRQVSFATQRSQLFANRPHPAGMLLPGEGARTKAAPQQRMPRMNVNDRYATLDKAAMAAKSHGMLEALEKYQVDSSVQAMREQRRSLPVTQQASDVLAKIDLNPVTIVMAATGSGKTTQIPQLLLDDYILRNEGASCNIICTQPRRIAAISVAQRVAKERGERLGETVGYQVRFESKPPQHHGSIAFCTTGNFLRRLQSALGDEADSSNSFLDSLTHIVVDEAHERDVETDLLLVVVKRLLAKRRERGKREIKLVIMSATIDPSLFQKYFMEPPPSNRRAPVVEVAGRSFPVSKHFLETTYEELMAMQLEHGQGGWVFREKNVQDYLRRELGEGGGLVVSHHGQSGSSEMATAVDDLEIPYALVALMIANVIVKSQDGHVLCFLPGLDEIKAVSKILADPRQHPLLGLDFTDDRFFEVHILHSSIPLLDQQRIFEPPPAGVRRIILSTNIAETSVTIPDVVYVVDTGRVKEKRYDPERHLASLVSAWVGTSNLNQRAGRAGRHRAGEYYGVLSLARYNKLATNQTVEMKRVDLSNVVMHIKALNMSGMDVEEVLDAAIEPPAPERVRAAVEKLRGVGALDGDKNLTSLGKVLLQLPVDASIGKMCLYGAFFRCLDPALTLAAILTNRDPFMAPMDLKAQANAVKGSWCPQNFRSDALTTLCAFNEWDSIQRTQNYHAANRFCSENFLSKPTMLQILQVKDSLFDSMRSAGIIDVVLGASSRRVDRGDDGLPVGPASFARSRVDAQSPELNQGSRNFALLSALVAMSSAPNFAIRAGERSHRTSQDKSCFIHPGSVCHEKFTKNSHVPTAMRELYAFGEKAMNTSQMASNSSKSSQPMTFLRSCTRLDPLTYVLFGASEVRTSSHGLDCDDWLPVSGNYEMLDDLVALKAIMDVCMLRVFQGIGKSSSRAHQYQQAGDGDSDDAHAKPLAKQEIADFEMLTLGIVNILEGHVREREAASANQSRTSTRPATPNGNGYDAQWNAFGGAYDNGPPFSRQYGNGGGNGSGGYNTPSSGPPSSYYASAPTSGYATPYDRPQSQGYGGGGFSSQSTSMPSWRRGG